MKISPIDLSEYYAIANQDMVCLMDLFRQTIAQLTRFIETYEEAIQTHDQVKFRDNLHRMYAVFEMLKMNRMLELAQEGKRLVLNENSSKILINSNLEHIKALVFEVITEVEAHISKVKISS